MEPESRAITLPAADLPRLSFEDGVDTSQIVPIRIKVAAEGEKPNAFYAPNADRLVATLDYAQLLEANAASRTPEAQEATARLRDAKALVDANVIAAEAWKGWVCDGEETYATSVAELVEQIVDMGGEAPTYCYTTHEKGFDFDLEDAIETYLMDEHHEDAECSHLDKLLAFYEEWKKGETVTTYWPAKPIIVIDAARFAIEIDAAKALIAKSETA